MARMASAAPLVERHIAVLDDKSVGFGCRDATTVCVTCQQVREGSVSKVFHLGLPAGAQVRLLRQRLKPHLPSASAVLASHQFQPGKMVFLEDGDFVPDKVILTKFDSKISAEMVLTKHQCCKVQRLLQLIFETPEIQQRLNDFQREAGGVEQKYRWRLAAMLQCEIYPCIARHFSLDEKAGAALPVSALGWHSQYDPRMTEAWLNLEILMRNKDSAAMAMAQLARLQWPDDGSASAAEAAGAEADPYPEPESPEALLAGATGAGGPDPAARGAACWGGGRLLRSALQDGEDLMSAELRLSGLLEDPGGGARRREMHARRAAVRLELGLYDAALADAVAAEDAEGAADAYVAANAGLQRYEEALEPRGCVGLAAPVGAVREHLERLRSQSEGQPGGEPYWAPDPPALLPRVAERLGPVKLGLLGSAGTRRRCLLAARAVEPGELLLCSNALVRMRSAGGKTLVEQMPAMPHLRESVAVAVAVYRRAAQISAHAAHVLGSALSDGCFRAVLPMRELFWCGAPQSKAGVDDSVVSGAVCTNAFKDLDHSVFPAASMANHSCLPNAVVVKLGDAFLLRARKSIGQGQEVTINYFDILTPLHERVERCKNWRFTCSCCRCEAEKRIPRLALAVPLAMHKQLCGMRTVAMGGGNVHEVLEELETAVNGFYGGKGSEALWIFAGFMDLYTSLAEASETSEAWDKLLQLFEVVHPGSFVHCKLSLNRWRVARNRAEEAPRAWRQCVEAHRLRYGDLARDSFMRLLGETRRSVDERREEFCME